MMAAAVATVRHWFAEPKDIPHSSVAYLEKAVVTALYPVNQSAIEARTK